MRIQANSGNICRGPFWYRAEQMAKPNDGLGNKFGSFAVEVCCTIMKLFLSRRIGIHVPTLKGTNSARPDLTFRGR